MVLCHDILKGASLNQATKPNDLYGQRAEGDSRSSLKRPRFYLALGTLLITLWILWAAVIALSPTSWVRACMWPYRRILKLVGRGVGLVVGEKGLQRLRQLLPLRVVLKSLGGTFSESDLDEIETGLAFLLFLEGGAFYVFQEAKVALRDRQPPRAKVDNQIMFSLTQLMIRESSPTDLVHFINYSWYCDPNPLGGHDGVNLVDWRALDDLQRRFGVAFPKITREAVCAYLGLNLALTNGQASIIVDELEVKLLVKLPSLPNETSDPSGVSPRMQFEKRKLRALERRTVEKTFCYGRYDATPLHRPLTLCLLLMAIETLVGRVVMPALGYQRFKSVRVDLERVMRFYVLAPNVPPSDGDKKLEASPTSMRSCSPTFGATEVVSTNVPLVFLHGFGLGLIPYFPLLFFLSRTTRSRQIIVPEFRWLGLMPLGGGLPRELPLFLARAILRTVRSTIGRIKTLLSKSLIWDPFPDFWQYQEHGEDLGSKRLAPHQIGPEYKRDVQSPLYLPTMPEVVDEIISFIYYYREQWPGQRRLGILERIFQREVRPAVKQAKYRFDCYRQFWAPDEHLPESPHKGAAPLTPRSGTFSFLRSGEDLEEICMSRREFLTRMRCRGDKSNQEKVTQWLNSRIRYSHTQGGHHRDIRWSSMGEPLSDGDCDNENVIFDLIGHSYGTAVSSCMMKTYSQSIRKTVMIDPVCWFVQLTKKCQLLANRPWSINLHDRVYSHLAPVLRQGGAVGMMTRALAHLPYLHEIICDRTLLFIYWYVVYRDFGTVWTCCRQLQGHEYIDKGEVLAKTQKGELMVIVGTRDLICPGHSILNFMRNKLLNGTGNKIISLPDHHGGFIFRPSVFRCILRFLN